MITRVLIRASPFTAPPLLSQKPWQPPDQWPCRWLLPPTGWDLPLVLCWRLVLDLVAPLRTRIHISADERYELWLDGVRCGQGPERGDERHWAYESYDLDLPSGRHVLIARTWALGSLAPWAQRSLGPAFLCAASDEALPYLGTGVADWRVRRLNGYRFTGLPGIGSGPAEDLDAASSGWDPHDASDGPAWCKARSGEAGNNGSHIMLSPRRLLEPASLPEQEEKPWSGARVLAGDDAFAGSPWHEGSVSEAWDALLAGTGSLTVPPGCRRRALIDLGAYRCGRPELSVTGGAGGSITVVVAEALARRAADGRIIRGSRHGLEGGWMPAAGDVLRPDGTTDLRWRPLWWRAGRLMEVVVEATTEPVTLARLGFSCTGYPFTVSGGGRGLDQTTSAVHAACRATWQACAHETYMDCPHYEQLMYVGDTRIQALITYVLSADDRLPCKAIGLFDSGRVVGRGLIPDAYPTGNVSKLIPPFNLWWVAMVHDHAWWRGGPATRRHLPGVRAVLDLFLAQLGEDGLWPSPGDGWNFLDICAGFRVGTPPGGEEGGRNCSFNWQLVHALGQWADLEDIAGEPELAARARRRRDGLVAAILRMFWDGSCFAEDPSHGVATEHAHVLALLSGVLPPGIRDRSARRLIAGDGLVRTSLYFSHYLFEALADLDRGDLLQARLADWQRCIANGQRTTPESFGETRSDCHAWSAHPLFHHLATVLGVRPGSPGFASVRIAPLPGPLESVAGDVAHPLGTIHADLRRVGQGLQADIVLPNGLGGELVWAGQRHALQPGTQSLWCPGMGSAASAPAVHDMTKSLHDLQQERPI